MVRETVIADGKGRLRDRYEINNKLMKDITAPRGDIDQRLLFIS
jgi:hypothetical protein